jgi:hypothetical protein
MASELGMRRFKLAAALILIMVIAGHGLPIDWFRTKPISALHEWENYPKVPMPVYGT